MIQHNVIELTNILLISNVLTNDQCKLISKEIIDYKTLSQYKTDLNMQLNSNAGCWMGMPQKNNGFSKDVENLLSTTILSACYKYLECLKPPTNMIHLNTDYLDKSTLHIHAWCNVNNPGSENYLHCHPGNLMSGVLWLQAENTGVLEFVPSNYLHKLSHPAWPFHGVSRYDPKDGSILVFPSYLLHRVEKNNSNNNRITMAFDVELAEK